ncbi:amidohydrolase-domain-containing protein [Lentinula aciculospora]|uniref:Amidohydrolase-domain-containing protein n=1 Tax=Lentinula aciculospora TaxID=153920 RepID=A0A9W9AEN0_9AGAR|nr:amidohydrolase-domain-containing protein [Lentinula aciculospora]
MNVHNSLDLLRKTAFTFPAIDNHAHPLLCSNYRAKVPFEAIISEASSESGLIHATQTVACFRAASQLLQTLGVERVMGQSPWQQVKQRRDAMDYEDLCNTFMKRCGIQSILLDDGLGGVSEWSEDWKWHRRFGCDTKRIVRIEIEAEKLLSPLLQPLLASDFDIQLSSQITGEVRNQLQGVLTEFFHQLEVFLINSAQDPEVVSFKSIACYRGGLSIRPRADIRISTTQTEHNYDDVVDSLFRVLLHVKHDGTIRLAHGAINDWIIHWALRVAGEFDIPVQFHTGLGDSDISLLHASPAHMQPLFKDYPQTVFVLLHAAYPFTKEAGYLCSVYPNVMLDFGEIFPMVSELGQRTAIREVLELCPTNKILWSTDGHWHPESFYLGTIQARKALFDVRSFFVPFTLIDARKYQVLSEIVLAGELTEFEAARIVEQALFWNSERVYKLGISPDMKITEGFELV